MIKKKILIALIVFCSFLSLYFFFWRKDEHPINLINLDVYIHEKLIRLGSVYTHIQRKNDSDTYLVSYQTFEELKDLIKSNEQSTGSSLNVDSNNSLRFEPPDDSTYRFIWYESKEKKTAAQYENLQVEEHRGNILIIERICTMDDVMITQQYALLAE